MDVNASLNEACRCLLDTGIGSGLSLGGGVGSGRWAVVLALCEKCGAASGAAEAVRKVYPSSHSKDRVLQGIRNSAKRESRSKGAVFSVDKCPWVTPIDRELSQVLGSR